jgi:hypothetical protein
MPRSIRTITTAIAIAALAAPTALAQPADIHAPLAKAASDSHKQHLRSPDTRDAAPATTPSDRNTARPDTAGSPNLTTAADRALAQERYYMSYGEPEPLTLPQSPVPSDDTPWLPIALSITAVLRRRDERDPTPAAENAR